MTAGVVAQLSRIVEHFVSASRLQPVTLITGASSGIGAALADVFAARGHRTVLVARREQRLAAVADAIAAAGNERPHTIALDLSAREAPERLATELAARGFEPEIVVNNAGFALFGAAAELDRGRQLEMIDLHVRALTDLSLRWVDSLVRHRGGILNVASIGGFLPGPGMAVYHASKAFVVSFSEALNRELAPLGVRVTVLCPGPVDTELQARAGIPASHYPRVLIRSAERVAREGYEGLRQGRRRVVPGFANKVVTFLPRLLPRATLLDRLDRHWKKAGRRRR